MDKTYKRHSFTKLWIATAMFIFCCFATSAFAQEAVDADTFMTTTETITEVHLKLLKPPLLLPKQLPIQSGNWH